jgi:hypothetical protein
MTERPARPFWLDDLQRKHEAYHYGENETRIVEVEHEGRSLRILTPETVPLTSVNSVASVGDLLFLIGEQLGEEGVDGSIIEGGDGVVMVARKMENQADTYWLLVWHWLFPETLDHLDESFSH